MLNINGNGFTTWEEVSKLGQIFPKLKVQMHSVRQIYQY
jgi:hypothetical protein